MKRLRFIHWSRSRLRILLFSSGENVFHDRESVLTVSKKSLEMFCSVEISACSSVVFDHIYQELHPYSPIVDVVGQPQRFFHSGSKRTVQCSLPFFHFGDVVAYSHFVCMRCHLPIRISVFNSVLDGVFSVKACYGGEDRFSGEIPPLDPSL